MSIFAQRRPREPDPTLLEYFKTHRPRHVILSATTLDPVPTAHRAVHRGNGVTAVGCTTGSFNTFLRADVAMFICNPCRNEGCFPDAPRTPWQEVDPAAYCHICTFPRNICTCDRDFAELRRRSQPPVSDKQDVKPQSFRELSHELGWPEPAVELSSAAMGRIRALHAELKAARVERDRYRNALQPFVRYREADDPGPSYDEMPYEEWQQARRNARAALDRGGEG